MTPEGKGARAPMRVLIVEDNPERQQILTALYRAHAWVLVHTGPRAITLLNAFEFDLVTLDYHLAGELTGADVARSLLESRNRGACLVIHSMNSAGAEEILGLLPNAVAFPISKMTRSNAVFKRLRERIDSLGSAYEWNE